LTITIATALVLAPPAPVAVAVKFVEDEGVTVIEPLGPSVPLTPLMVTELALVELHVRVVLPPGLTFVGEALTVTVTPAPRLTVALAVALPLAPVAVAV
jgi:hypothetical protein